MRRNEMVKKVQGEAELVSELYISSLALLSWDLCLSHLCLCGEKSDDFKSFASCILHRVCETQSNFDSCTWKCEKEMEPGKHKTPMSKSDLHLMFTPESLPSYKVYRGMQQRWTTCNRMFLIDLVASLCLLICLGSS